MTSPTSTTVQSPGTTALNNLTGLTSSMKLEDEPAEPPPDVYTKQDEDPFAASESADPFNKTDAPSGDPFGTSADDPFVEKAADPFAKADDAFGGDPFGAGADPFGSSSDPFGGVSEDETTKDAITAPEVNVQWGDYKVFGVYSVYSERLK